VSKRIPMWCELVCHVCSRCCMGQFCTAGSPRNDLVKQARHEGWRFEFDECFCSDQCLHVYTENLVKRLEADHVDERRLQSSVNAH
jgi:hypothetical protein